MIGFNRYTFTLLIRTNAGVTNFSNRFNLVTFESFTKITKFERLRIIVYQTRRINLATTPTGKGDYQMNGSRNNDNWEAYPFRAMHRRLTSISKYMRHYGPAIAIAGGCWWKSQNDAFEDANNNLVFMLIIWNYAFKLWPCTGTYSRQSCLYTLFNNTAMYDTAMGIFIQQWVYSYC